MHWYLIDNTRVIYLGLQTLNKVWAHQWIFFLWIYRTFNPAGLSYLLELPATHCFQKNPLMGVFFIFPITVLHYILLLTVITKTQGRVASKCRWRRALISSFSVPVEWRYFQYKTKCLWLYGSEARLVKIKRVIIHQVMNCIFSCGNCFSALLKTMGDFDLRAGRLPCCGTHSWVVLLFFIGFKREQ